jgi:tetratricopeptide (TPR) repeat protein
MNVSRWRWRSAAVALLATAMLAQSARAGERFALVSAVPDDVFLVVAGRHNPERAFIDAYWSDVLGAVKEAGVARDVLDLISSKLAAEKQQEMERLLKLFEEIIAGVDWSAMCGGEVVYAQRMNKPIINGRNLNMGPPDMLLLARGGVGSAEKNFQGLTAILRTLTDEVNRVAGTRLAVETSESHGATVARLNLLPHIPQAPPMVLSVARRDELIAINFGEKLLVESLELQAGTGSKPSIAKNGRFQKAFAGLPEAEDELSFFDMQLMLEPFRVMLNHLVEMKSGAGAAEDTILNSRKNPQGDDLNRQALTAYGEGNHQEALRLIRQSHEAAPDDSLIMYNLACFNALVGNRDEALGWLDKAVAGGFHAPEKIAEDSDLGSLREDPRYLATVDKARELARQHTRQRPMQIKALVDRLIDVPAVLDYIAEVAYTEGHVTHTVSTVALVADAPSKPIYAVFGRPTPLTRYDQFVPREAVSFSVSSQIDLVALYDFIIETIGSVGEKGAEVLAKWEEIQKQYELDVRRDVLAWISGESVSVQLPQPPFGSGGTFLLKVKDEKVAREKVAAFLEFGTNAMKELAKQNPMMGMLALRVTPCTHERLSGFHEIAIGMMPQPAVCGVTDGYLIFASSADSALLCLDTASGKHPSIRENTQVMSELLAPKGSFTSLSFVDQRNLGNEIAQFLGIFSMVGGMMTMAIPEPEVQQVVAKVAGIISKLAPAAQKIDFYKSTSTYATYDGQKWQMHSVTNYFSPAERAARAAPSTTGSPMN